MEAQEAHEIGDTIAEGGHEEHAEASFRRAAAVILGVIAMLLAIASLLGEAAMKETINFNIKASDTFAFYQAKNERQTTLQIAADQLEALAASHPEWSGAARAGADKLIAGYRATVARYESDPKTGEGKKELLQKARDFEVLRDTRQRQDRYFDYAEALLQIAIVLASVSIVTGMLGVRLLSYAMAGIGVVLLFDAFTLSFAIPFL